MLGTHSTHIQPHHLLFQFSWPVTCCLPFNTLIYFFNYWVSNCHPLWWEEPSSYIGYKSRMPSVSHMDMWGCCMLLFCFRKFSFQKQLTKINYHSFKKEKLKYHGISKNSQNHHHYIGFFIFLLFSNIQWSI